MRGSARCAVIVAASGFAGLGLQIVWTQQLGLALGHEAAAVLATVAAFFGGLAAGAFALGGRIARGAKPARWYAACEALVGVWAVALVFLMAPLTQWLTSFVPLDASPLRQWSCVFGGAFVLLLPATAAMGATLPAMERVLRQFRHDGIALLYAANTAGAVLGALGSAFVLVPVVGLKTTALACAAIDIACALAVWRGIALAHDDTAATAARSPGPVANARAELGVLASTGLLGIGYEVLVVRALSQVAENTVYTFAILLAVYLVGTAAGAAWYARRPPRDERIRDRLLQLLAASVALGMLALAAAPGLKAWLAPHGVASALGVETLLAFGAFLLPTVIMGALFSEIATAAGRAGVGFARVLGVNTLGAAAAPALFGIVSLSLVGTKFALALVAVGYLLLAARQAWATRSQLATAALVVAVTVLAPSLAHVDVPPGGRIVSLREGPLGTVSVVEDAAGVATLHIDNKQQEGSSATVFADARQGLLPALLHPAPNRVLFLGLGTGITSRAASQLPGVQVDVVELLPEVIDAARAFATALPAQRAPVVFAADARRFVRGAHDAYDVIVADNFHPARSGSGSLYTVEHFAAVRARLAPGGLFCQWLPLHQLDLETLRSIVRSFIAVNPRSFAVLATNSLDTPVIGLIAGRDATFSSPRADESRRAIGTRFGFPDDLSVLGSFIAGPQALAKFAGDATLNTDDHPVVVYAAPRITYAPDSTPRERLFALLDSVSVTQGELSLRADADFARRLDAYWQARNRYLAAGRDVRAVSDVRGMLAQVRGPLLDVLRVSPDFRPAYDPLLSMAEALAEVDPAGARALLNDLAAASPERPEAARILRQLHASAAQPSS